MKKKKFDFSGWATKNDLLCADGRTIRKDAFKDDDGRTVPLVYQHNHDDPTRVIGHALLENREDGVYAYCSLNNTDMGRHARECVRHGDFDSLSIYANKLVQRGGDVIHGVIRELSLVLAGANPGAKIEFPMLAHGEESETEATIWHDDMGFEMEEGMKLDGEDEESVSHAEAEKPAKEEPKKEEPAKEEAKPEPKAPEKEEKDETVQDVLDSMTDKQRKVVEYLVAQALGGDEDEEDEEEAEHDDMDDGEEVSHADGEDDETVQDVLDSMNDKQRKVTEYLVAQALESAESEEDEDEEEPEEEADEAAHSDSEGEEFTMKKNVFDNEAMVQNENDTLTHAQMDTLFKDAKRLGSLRQSVLEHTAEYGIDQINWLFPEDRATSNTPMFIQRDMGWVTQVMGAVSHTPFSRIKTLFADITEEQARALGYIKGKAKKTEVFKLLKRTTDPQTIYKKQKLDRDDVVDITDFDVVAWMKQEMRLMLDEEIARAILVGDGRAEDSDDHISDDHIHSVFHDDEDLFVIRKQFAAVQGEEKAKTLIKLVRKAWKDYKGSGNATAYMTEDALSDLMLLEDSFGHFLYPTKDVVANVLGVQNIVTVPPMADPSTFRVDEDDDTKGYRPLMIIVNMKDYNVGADKGGSVNMFEDFDIDYNAQKYLIETRCSGALVRPFSAIIIEDPFTIESENDEP